ncbi:MAG TPA: NTP transferase domain-containing protein [Candidatus Baltobacteraceae bacterium]|nr:NTP transferase domain-containing protein [Candidatus Baltobacteraceae bacterium]
MLTVVVLAAGRSRRFGSDKLLHGLPGGETLLERAVRAGGAFDSVLVCSPAIAARARALHPHTIVNRHPERGMSYSLRLANAAIAPESAIAVLPADLLLIGPHDVACVAASIDGADVAFPVRSDGTPGHPVVFAAGARPLIEQLCDGEPIACVRDRAGLTRRLVAIEEPWPYRDVDTPADI